MRQEFARVAGQAGGGHDLAIGGILAGKRLAGNRIAVVAASSPGPTPDNRQLGFALDQAQGNAMLEQWYAHDPDVDFIGLWHTHPSDLDRPTADDVQVAQKLLLDPASDAGELLSAIVLVASAAPDIGWFYLSDTAARGGEAYATVTYEALDDGDPVFREPKVAVTAGIVADAAAEPPVEAAQAPRRSRRWLVPASVGLLVVLLTGLALARVANRPDARAGRDAPGGVVGTRVAMMTDTPRVTVPLDGAPGEAPPETAPANTPTMAPAVAATLPPEPSRPPSAVASQPPALVDAGTPPPGESAML